MTRSQRVRVALYGAQRVPDCDAIAVNHGQFTCISWGTPYSDPWAFAALTAALISGFGFVAITRFANKGFFSPECEEVVRSAINAFWLSLGLRELPLRSVRSAILGALVMGVLAAIFLISALLSYVHA
jgi:hypothetical protein